MVRLRTLLALFACLALAAGLAACGGGDDDSGSNSIDEDTDAATVLDRTFDEDNQIESSVLDLAFDFNVTRGDTSSTFNAEITGPIDSSGDGLPVFDLEGKIKAESPQRTIDESAGAISTGDAAFISYKGKNYEVDPQTFGFLSAAFQRSEDASSAQESDAPKGLPGIRDSLTNVKNEGTEDVEGVESVHVSGAVDVDGLIDRIRPLAEQASALGLGAAGQIPTPAELDGLSELVRSATFDVYSGADDNLLRRFTVDVMLDQPGGSGTAELKIDLTLGDVNEPQTVEAPEDVRPLSELLNEVGLDGLGLSGLGGLGGGGGNVPLVPPSDSGSGGGGAGGTGGPGTGGAGGGATPPGNLIPQLPQGVPQVPTPEEAQEYIDCLEEVASGDSPTASDLMRCQEILR